jgi:hypothetical protein
MREIIRSHEISTSWSFGPVPVFNWRFQTGQLCSLQFRFNRVFRCVDSPAFSHALKVIALIFETCITKIQGSPQRLKYLGIVSEFRRFIVTGRNFISLIACGVVHQVQSCMTRSKRGTEGGGRWRYRGNKRVAM